MGGEKKESAKVYNIVDSVKGGSGKTTFALMLSLLLDKKLTESRENGESSVCLVDMDIQGSALLYLLFGKSFLDGEKDRERIAYLNDRVIAVGEESDMNTTQMKCFVALYNLRSFTKAAEILYMSQPAMSKNISALEASRFAVL